jgi:hypothetical protein
MSNIDKYCKVCGKRIKKEENKKCSEDCWKLLTDTEVIEVSTPGSKYYFYQSPHGSFFHMIWRTGVDSWDVMPIKPTEYDKKIKEANQPGYWYDSTNIYETPLDQVKGVNI